MIWTGLVCVNYGELNWMLERLILWSSPGHTLFIPSTLLILDGTVLNESADVIILDVTLAAKMTFEKLLRSVSWAAAQRLGIMRKSLQVFNDRSLLLRYFWSFVTLVLVLLLVLAAVVLSCLLRPQTTGHSCQKSWFFSWRYFIV